MQVPLDHWQPHEGRVASFNPPASQQLGPNDCALIPPKTIWPKTGGRIPSLDGLRAVSIILVLVNHATIGYQPTNRSLWTAIVFSILGNGMFGVQVFFVISGFLITHLLVNEYGRRGTIDLKQFYIRRVFRIFPAFYLMVGTVACFSLVGIFDATKSDVLHAATFTWLYNFGVWNWYLSHTWSLSVEEQFYLFWPAAIIFAGPKRVVWLAVFMIVVVPCARGVLTLPTSKLVHRTCYVLMAGHFDVLMFGCVAALMYPSQYFQEMLQRPSATWSCAVLALGAVATASIRFLVPKLDAKILTAGFADTIIGLGICAAMIGVVSRPRSAVGRLLNHNIIAWVGTLSYSIYLWQQVFLTPTPVYGFQKLPWNVCLVFVFGVASFYLIEQPLIRIRVRLSQNAISLFTPI